MCILDGNKLRKNRYLKKNIKIFSKGKAVRVCIPLIALMLSGCFGEEPQKISCFPDPISINTSIVADTEKNQKAIHASVYLDASVSMRGFLKGSKEGLVQESLFKTTLENLPSYLDRLTKDPIRYSYFGDDVQAVSATTFITETGTNAAYKKDKTKIDLALNEIVRDFKLNQDTSPLSLVITDMFLSTDDLNASQGQSGAIFRPLRGLITDGAAIAFLGVRNPFEEVIYDLPGPTDRIRGYKGERPFFIILVGEEPVVARTLHLLYRELTVDTPEGAVNAILFGKNGYKNAPVMTIDTRNRARGIGSTKYSPRAPFEALPDTIGHFKVGTGEGRITFEIPNLRGAFKPFYVHATEGEVVPKLSWISQRNLKLEGCKRGWRTAKDPVRDADIKASVNLQKEEGSSGTITIMENDIRKVLVLPETTYHLEFAILSNPENTSEPALPEWLKKWSFSPSDVSRLIAEPPGFFPALNLEAISKILVDLIMEEQKSKQLARAVITFEQE